MICSTLDFLLANPGWASALIIGLWLLGFWLAGIGLLTLLEAVVKGRYRRQLWVALGMAIAGGTIVSGMIRVFRVEGGLYPSTCL